MIFIIFRRFQGNFAHSIDVVSLQVAKQIVLQLVSLQIAQLFYCFASCSETILKSPFHAFPRYNCYGFAVISESILDGISFATERGAAQRSTRSVAKPIPESMLSLITAIQYAIVSREGMEGRF